MTKEVLKYKGYVLLLNETVSGKIFGIEADLHYQSDREVTKNKAPDFNV